MTILCEFDENTLDRLAPMRLRPGLSSAVLAGLYFVMVVLTQGLKAHEVLRYVLPIVSGKLRG